MCLTRRAEGQDRGIGSNGRAIGLKGAADAPRNFNDAATKAAQSAASAAAAGSRLLGDWRATNTSMNSDLYRGLDKLRARSRDLCNNNDYAKRFIAMVKANVVGGTGVQLQSRSPRTKASSRVSSARSVRGPSSKPPALRPRAQAPSCC